MEGELLQTASCEPNKVKWNIPYLGFIDKLERRELIVLVRGFVFVVRWGFRGGFSAITHSMGYAI